MPLPARRVALAWDLLYRSASLRCTAAKSVSSHSVGKAQHLRSRFRSSLSGRCYELAGLAMLKEPDAEQLTLVHGTVCQFASRSDLSKFAN
jgi:hypothetical protein